MILTIGRLLVVLMIFPVRKEKLTPITYGDGNVDLEIVDLQHLDQCLVRSTWEKETVNTHAKS